ncbi:hypothetical protein NEFER03_1321 [Nematocida sp. LUAm3]|nr:hypothetical protein NEFER03_1321 [Nematocida sp. LUAm3]KAI5174057.1 hypothetical protein NEFER02_0524 [Nematocida sp. LUAm2]KAI5177200.1 hypothetical protein NEFER01_0475 [Nematocida sp. LUAm1]
MFWLCALVLLGAIVTYAIVMLWEVRRIERIIRKINRGEVEEKKGLYENDTIVRNIVRKTLEILVFVLALRFDIIKYGECIGKKACGCTCIALYIILCVSLKRRYFSKNYLFWIGASYMLETSIQTQTTWVGLYFLVYIFLKMKQRVKIDLLSGKNIMFLLCVGFIHLLLKKDYLFIRSLFMIDQRKSIEKLAFVYTGVIVTQMQYLDDIYTGMSEYYEEKKGESTHPQKEKLQ